MAYIPASSVTEIAAMPGIEEDLRAALIADEYVNSLLGERGIYATKIPPHNAPSPWLYFLIASEKPIGLIHKNDSDQCEVELEIFAATYAEARTVKLATRAVLNTYRGGHIRRMLWTGSDSGPVEGGHNITERYTVYGSTPTIIPAMSSNARIVTGEGRIDLYPNGSGVSVWIDSDGLLHGGGDGLPGYTHDQPTPASTWVVNHNLGVRPAVEVRDVGGRQIEAEVVHANLDQCAIYFSGPTAGSAYCSQ